jgi:hypothetical protein
MTISYQMFSLEKKYLTKDFLAFGVLPFFILYSAFMIISSTCIPSASAFMNQNLLGLYSPNNPVPIVPTNPSMNSFYGGGYGYGGGVGQSFGTGLVGLLPQVLGLGTGYSGYGYDGGGGVGQSFGTGLVGLLPQVLGGIGSLFGQDSGSGYSMGGGYDSGYGFGPPSRDSQGLSGILGGIGSLFGQDSGSGYSMGGGYDSGYQSYDDQGFSDFQTSNDPFASGSDSSTADPSNYLDDYSSDSSSSSPFDDLRSMDSSSGDPFSSNQDSGSSSSPFDDLRSMDSSSGDPFSSNQDSGSSGSLFRGLFD